MRNLLVCVVLICVTLTAAYRHFHRKASVESVLWRSTSSRRNLHNVISTRVNRPRLSIPSSLHAEGSSTANSRGKTKDALPRLLENATALTRWIEQHGGQLQHVQIQPSIEGWSLVNVDTDKTIPEDEVLLEIPKKLCIFSDLRASSLLPQCEQLMQSLPTNAWRVRLAIALLSERVRHKSFFTSYVMNLPFEFWGIPLFFSSNEFRLMQDFHLMTTTKERCRFLATFTQEILQPIQQKVNRDPFSNNRVDVNAFGWGFACASSRAIRLLGSKKEEESAVLIPAIDIASHSFTPNTELIELEDKFVLRSVVEIQGGEEITMNYGKLSNDELFADFGFTVDHNPYDSISLFIDDTVVNYARSIMGQSNFTDVLDRPVSYVNVAPVAEGHVLTQQYIHLGFQQDILHSQALSPWQQYWLRSLDLYGGNNQILEMKIGCVGEGGQQLTVDPRLRAYLRILYTAKEEHLLQQGYTPQDMLLPTSIVSLQQEAHVIRTMIGMLALLLRSFGSDIEKDMNYLRYELIDHDTASPVSSTSASSSSSAAAGATATNDPRDGMNPKKEKFAQVKFATLRILRNLFRIPHDGNNIPTDYLIPAPPSSSSPPKDSSDNKELSLEEIIRNAKRKYIEQQDAGNEEEEGEALDEIEISSDNESPSAVNDEEDEVWKESKLYGDNWLTKEDDKNQLHTLGLGLPVNVREAYRYRIRKKKMICDLIHQLAKQYQVSCFLFHTLLCFSSH